MRIRRRNELRTLNVKGKSPLQVQKGPFYEKPNCAEADNHQLTENTGSVHAYSKLLRKHALRRFGLQPTFMLTCKIVITVDQNNYSYLSRGSYKRN